MEEMLFRFTVVEMSILLMQFIITIFCKDRGIHFSFWLSHLGIPSLSPAEKEKTSLSNASTTVGNQTPGAGVTKNSL
jgi:hypothetical protein